MSADSQQMHDGNSHSKYFVEIEILEIEISTTW